MTERARRCRAALDRLARAAERAGRPLAFMEVCGTHTVAAFRSGLHSLMPPGVKLLSGPGCPVCVTSQGDIDLLTGLGTREPRNGSAVTLCTYGDMMRVTGSHGSLEQARAAGADVRVVYSAMDAVKLAATDRKRQVTFAAVGFETTAPATAAAVLAAEKMGLTNFTVLASHKLILPAMRALLDSGKVNIDGFLLPGHVSIVIGWKAYAPVAERYRMPCVVGGFEEFQIAAALARLAEMVADGKPGLENLYPEAVTADGNATARGLMERVFEPCDVPWRALGVIPGSGLRVRSRYSLYDAGVRFQLKPVEAPEPRGCRCGEVITGRCTPADCRLFGTACTPTEAVGPCMVSSEGTCAAWFKYGRGSRPGTRPATGHASGAVHARPIVDAQTEVAG